MAPKYLERVEEAYHVWCFSFSVELFDWEADPQEDGVQDPNSERDFISSYRK